MEIIKADGMSTWWQTTDGTLRLPKSVIQTKILQMKTRANLKKLKLFSKTLETL